MHIFKILSTIAFLILLLVTGSFGQEYSTVKFKSSINIENSYGICAHISRKGADWGLRNMDLQRINDAGINYVRTDFDWNGIQPPLPSKLFNFTYLDSMMLSLHNAKVNVLPILGYGIQGGSPAWKHTDYWKIYVTNLLNRYPQIPVWEVWNEMNIEASWKEGSSIKNYITLLKASYQAIKAVNSEKKVMLGGLAGMDKVFLTGLSEYNGQRFFDIMNFHYYSAGSSPEQMIDSCFVPLKQIMDKYHWNKPVWITETGYTTVKPLDDKTSFYTELLPEICSKLGIKPSRETIAFIKDDKYSISSIKNLDIDNIFYYFSHRTTITLDELKELNPKKIKLLVPTINESFPMVYFAALENYVRKGGTIILPYGAPLYYDKDLSDGKIHIVANTYCKRLHIDCLYWWDKRAMTLQIPKLADYVKAAPAFKTSYTWNGKNKSSLRYLTASNIKKGDKFIPVIEAGNAKYKGTVVALYKLNSDLKGNIIVQTRKEGNENFISEETQAKRLPRTYLTAFAFGVEKVFWYNLRAGEYSQTNPEAYFGILHKDLTPKPAYLAYQTLTRMCPNKSQRPILQIKDDIYIAKWQRPDSKKVVAIWTEYADKEIILKSKGRGSTFNYIGEKIKIDFKQFYARPGIIYFVGYDFISF